MLLSDAVTAGMKAGAAAMSELCVESALFSHICHSKALMGTGDSPVSM